MKIHESAENYLETILVLQNEKGSVRSIDVAQHLGFSKPSVSRAVGLLRENGYITVDEGGHLNLTESGRAIAESIYERHECITNWLMELGVDQETAAEDACRIEHVLSDKTFAALKKHFGKN
ncbi:MAG: metal-dependent transcriptional regulator [Butyricicoccus sp.]|nr:metal-dependent transcriptional regulator [Butyricicoccus sp.]MBQ8585118.1 metal-dependent transcriptional regulator [Butyricicoccus sp.]